MAKKKRGKRATVPVGDVLEDLRMQPLPKGAEPRAAFILVKTNKGWYARAVGGKAYKKLEFTTQLASFSRFLLVAESKSWH
jgi:hypothetical protein